ncbi:MAG TPA: polysaccharide biosynthesis C-terminal domain-containing protein [Mucilaginibacter sp.]|jgi:O-antigen/teichoic acid export membrane protein|nr:polysaccharide biosynthesis C-terminal domain-containing protein [Mucilaginibacter sp.]
MTNLLERTRKKIYSFKQNDLFTKSIGNLFVQIMGLGLSYFVVYLISRTYNADTLGYYILATVLLQVSIIVVLFGINTATVQMVPGFHSKQQNDAVNSVLIKGVVHIFVVGLLVTTIVYFSAGLIAIYLMHKPKLTAGYQMVSLAIIPFALFTFIADFLRALGKNILWAIIIQVLVFLIFIILFLFNLYAFKNPQPIAIYTIANFAAMAVTLIILMVCLKKEKLKLSFKYIKHEPSYKKIRTLSFPMFLFSSSLLLSGWVTIIMLGSLGTTTDTGIYRVVDRIGSLSVLILTAVNVVLAPKIAASFARNDFGLLKQNVLFSAKLIFWLSLPVQAILIIFHSAALFIFGHEFIRGGTALVIILTGQIFNSLTGPCGQVLNMTNHQVFLRNVSLVSLVIMVVINYFLIPRFGVSGAAVSSLFGNVFINILSVLKIKKEFSFNTIYNPFRSVPAR